MKASMMTNTVLILTAFLASLNSAAFAQSSSQAIVTYLGNEGLLFSDGEHKVLFDPFFHNVYGQYQAVPQSIQDAITSNSSPYDNIDVIVVSHSHGDHFSAESVATYLSNNEDVTLVAPSQATIEVIENTPSLEDQIVSLELEFGDTAVTTELGNIRIESVRIPHAGWPERQEIANLVHRVSLADQHTIIHMGDADPNDEHFAPFAGHWLAQDSELAFPPYWFFISPQGPMILQDRINAKEAVGVHVPVEVPEELIESGAEFFTVPGSEKVLR